MSELPFSVSPCLRVSVPLWLCGCRSSAGVSLGMADLPLAYTSSFNEALHCNTEISVVPV